MEHSDITTKATSLFGKRVGDLVNPSHPDYDPRYVEIVRNSLGQSQVSLAVPDSIRQAASAPKMPSLARQAVNLAGAVVHHVAAGLPAASSQVVAERLAICGQCEKYVNGRCSMCGCVASVKVEWLEQKCPLQKW